MKLKDLIREWPTLKVIGSKQIEITGISSDSRTVAPGNLFIAKKGNLQSGLEFVAQAVEAGASAIVSPIYNPFLKQTQLIHEEPELLEAHFAARYYGRPSKDLLVAGVTGSKGKTTTTYLLRHLLQGIGQPCGLLNTIEISIGKKYLPSLLTTHDAIWNQKLLREMVDSQCKAAVLEVSSHALAQRRVLEIDFDLAIFTNLYPDHLDYHKNLEAYALEKRKLFAMAEMGIYNADSPWTPFMREGRKGLTFGIQEPADIRAENISLLPGKACFTVQNHPFSISMMGRFNIANVLGAIAAGVYLGVPLDTLSSLLGQFPGVPGRLESVPNDLGISVFIDYAHTGEALENVLQTLREIALGKIIVVFGCGGGRDPGRRPAMGRAASRGADLSILTADNARNEDPEVICREILQGFANPEKAMIEIDRKIAIQKAIAMAGKGDVVLIAGKGHEQTQTFAHQTLPFHDFSIAKQELQIRQSSAILSHS